MGTRHLICVVVDDQFCLAQYGQWDGYPDGEGLRVLDFCRKHLTGKKKLKAAIAAFSGLEVASEEDVNRSYVEAGADEKKLREHGLISFDVGRRQSQLYPEYSRDTGAAILKLVVDRYVDALPLKILSKDPEFAADSLFCEWAYVLDLSNKRLEVFKGFQKAPHDKGRFANLPVRERDNKYFPVAEVARFDFDALPDDEEFLAQLAQDSDEE